MEIVSLKTTTQQITKTTKKIHYPMETKTLKKNLETIHHNLSFYLQKTPPIKIMAVSKQQAKSAIEKAQNQRG